MLSRTCQEYLRIAGQVSRVRPIFFHPMQGKLFSVSQSLRQKRAPPALSQEAPFFIATRLVGVYRPSIFATMKINIAPPSPPPSNKYNSE